VVSRGVSVGGALCAPPAPMLTLRRRGGGRRCDERSSAQLRCRASRSAVSKQLQRAARAARTAG
jgi:hypothetical protein